MGAKLNIDENYVINEYLNGKSSLVISKELKVSKPVILKIIKKNNLTRKRDRCKFLDIKLENNIYYIFRKCPGCGEKIKTVSKNRAICCRNHFRKLDSKSVCKSCLSKKQIGKNNSFYGKKHSIDSKNKISKNRIGKGMGEKSGMASLEVRKKLNEIIKKKWANGEMEHVRKIMSEKMKENIRLKKIKSYIKSKKENEIFDEIEKMGFDVIQSYRVDTKICDIFVPKLNLIIEYFGDYWHCNPKKYDENYINKKKSLTAKEIWEYDTNKLQLIKNYGYNLEVVWESDLKNDNKIISNIINNYDRKNKFAPERS